MTQAVKLAQLGSPGISTGFKNRIINGAMVIDQRNAGASVTPTTDNATFPVDRFVCRLSQASKFSAQQTTTVPAGFSNSLKITSLSAYTVGASEFFAISQNIEGFNTSDLAWGTASAKSVTLSFQVYSSLTGTFGGTIYNSNADTSYPFTYSVASANTWTSISVTIPGPTIGSWLGGNVVGINVSFSLGAGATVSGTANTWAGSLYRSATGATSVVGTNGATWYITGVQLEVGTTATSFDYLPYSTELQLCYRYFQKFLGSSTYEALPSYVIAGTTAAEGFLAYKGTMRSTPTLASSTLCLLDANGLFPISGTVATNNGVDSMRITYSGISGLTQYRSYYVTANNSTSAFLTLSAEL